MATRSTTRQLPPLEMRAAFAPKTVDVDARTVQVIWTTGAPVLRGYFDQYYEELSLNPKHVRMKRIQGGPLLDSHRAGSTDDIIGVVESATLEAKRGVATVRFDTGERGEEVFRKVREGMLRDISVGYRIHKMEKVEDAAGKVPVMRAVDWEPHEFSFTPIGADAGAVARSESTDTNPCEIIEEQSTMDETTPAGAPGNPPAPAPAPVVDAAAEARAAAINERGRVMQIQRLGRALSRPDEEISAAIDAGQSLEAFRASAVEAYAASTTITVAPRASITAGEDEREKFARGVEGWILERSGVGRTLREASESAEGKRIEEARGIKFRHESSFADFRHLTIFDIARKSLEYAGINVRGKSKSEVFGMALTMRDVGGLATTSDFPVLLEAILNKQVLAAYAIAPDTWMTLAKRVTLNDFRAHYFYRTGSFGVLDRVNEAGEFANKAIPDGKRESLTAATKGNIIGISRQALVNDDMNAFDSLAAALGRAARLSIETDLYALLALNAGLGPVMTDGLTLFHATHLNIGAPAAISINSIDADRVVLASQRDISLNDYIDLRPSVLLVPIGLGGLARQINGSQYDFDTANRFQVPNKVLGLFREIVDTPRITGTRRYLFADPQVNPTLAVGFLDGNDIPVLEQQQGWRVDGTEWKIRLDYGVGAIDWRTAVTNAGV